MLQALLMRGIHNADLYCRPRDLDDAIQSLLRPLSGFRDHGTVGIHSLMTVLHDAEADETCVIYPHRMPCGDFNNCHYDGYGNAIIQATQEPCAAATDHLPTSSGGAYGSPPIHYRAKHSPCLPSPGRDNDGHESESALWRRL